LRISEIKPLESPDTSWTPPFPGVSEAENCRDWDPGIPIDTSRIRTKDEDYWDKFHGTPKAFINLKTGQQMWQNRFGELTAIRYPASPSAAELEPMLQAKLDPAQLGLAFQPVRDQALAAARESMDFGQLFIGFSFFLIAAALLLMAMLFVFNLEQRSEEARSRSAFGRAGGEFFCSKASPLPCSERRRACSPESFTRNSPCTALRRSGELL
jgi:hypothetical protein